MTKGGEFLKKLWCCVGGGVKHENLVYQRSCINSVDKPNLPIKCFHFDQEKLRGKALNGVDRTFVHTRSKAVLLYFRISRICLWFQAVHQSAFFIDRHINPVGWYVWRSIVHRYVTDVTPTVDRDVMIDLSAGHRPRYRYRVATDSGDLRSIK